MPEDGVSPDSSMGGMETILICHLCNTVLLWLMY